MEAADEPLPAGDAQGPAVPRATGHTSPPGSVGDGAVARLLEGVAQTHLRRPRTAKPAVHDGPTGQHVHVDDPARPQPDPQRVEDDPDDPRPAHHDTATAVTAGAATVPPPDRGPRGGYCTEPYARPGLVGARTPAPTVDPHRAAEDHAAPPAPLGNLQGQHPRLGHAPDVRARGASAGELLEEELRVAESIRVHVRVSGV